MRQPFLLLIPITLLALACSKDQAKSEAAAEAPTEGVVESPAPTPYELSAEQASLIFDSKLQTLSGEDTSLASMRGKPILVVNVASECGLTPQYEELQALYKEHEAKGFVVVGFPCNQFGGQEPGTPEEILAFGKEHYGVTFPLMQKVETNGPGQHPIYQALTQIKDAKGKAGDVEWNFEKFLLSADGKRVTRFRPGTLPSASELTSILQADL